MINLREYHDFYLTTDVFQSFRKAMLHDRGLDY